MTVYTEALFQQGSKDPLKSAYTHMHTHIQTHLLPRQKHFQETRHIPAKGWHALGLKSDIKQILA